METSAFNKIQNGDSVVTEFNETLEVRYINRSEGWVELSDEEDTIRSIAYPKNLVRHIPFV